MYRGEIGRLEERKRVTVGGFRARPPGTASCNKQTAVTQTVLFLMGEKLAAPWMFPCTFHFLNAVLSVHHLTKQQCSEPKRALFAAVHNYQPFKTRLVCRAHQCRGFAHKWGIGYIWPQNTSWLFMTSCVATGGPKVWLEAFPLLCWDGRALSAFFKPKLWLNSLLFLFV